MFLDIVFKDVTNSEQIIILRFSFFSVWAAHKNFAVLVFVICRQKYLIYSREEKIGTWPLRLRYKAEVERLGESRVAGLIIMMAREMLSIVGALSHVYKRGKG